MSKLIITSENQSIIDIAVQHCGNVDRAMDIVNANTFITLNDLTGDVIDLGWPLLHNQSLVIEDEWAEAKIIKELTENISTAE